jgi:hypothetical protein
MGGLTSYGNDLPLTTSFDVSVYGGSRNTSQYGGSRYTHAHHHGTSGVREQSVGGCLVISLVARSLPPTSLDLSILSQSAVAAKLVEVPVALKSDVTHKPDSTIKDKPSDLGIKPIKDNESWLNAKKIIESHLCCTPYWAGPSDALITTDTNIAASIWWEGVIAYFCEPPVSNLFVGEACFDGKGFECIDYIDRHFHPSGAVDVLGYIFDLINIKQRNNKPIVSLKAHFSQSFSSLKLGGISIDSGLQVSFMLCALLGCYHAVVQEFCLSRHPLNEASLQTVVDQSVNFDKDLFLGPMDKDGNVVQNPLANAVNAAPRDGKNVYEALAAKSFNYHLDCWKKALLENKGKCMFCHDSVCNTNHKSRDYPILKKLGFKLEKWMDSDKADATSWVTTPPTGNTTKPAQTPAPASNATFGSGSLPGGFSAAAEPVLYDSGEDYDYKGKSSESMYSGTSSDKPNSSSLAYISLSPSYNHTSGVTPDMGGGVNDSSSTPDMGGDQVQVHSVSRSSRDPQGVKMIYLPKTVLTLLQNPHAYKPDNKGGGPGMTLLVTDMGATDHMLPNKTALISYYPVFGQRFRMGNNSFAPIRGCGTAIISLNGKKILIRDCLHVPDLKNPLYSFRAHQRQRGCDFIGMYGLGFHVFFPTFIIKVDTATDCHLHYAPVGCSGGPPRTGLRTTHLPI